MMAPGLLIGLSIGSHTDRFPGFDLLWIQTLLTAIFTELRFTHWRGFKHHAKFFFATPHVWSD